MTASLLVEEYNIKITAGMVFAIIFSTINGAYISSASVNVGGEGFKTHSFIVPENCGRITFCLQGNSNTAVGDSVKFSQPKLEFGEVATKFVNKTYLQEFCDCQRYCQVRSSGYNFATSASDRCPMMRASGTTGSVTIDGITYKYADAEIY
jgi:hypothetical protein